MTTLPLDVLHLICEELSNRTDFHSLFSCAVASKALVAPALLWLYRIQNIAVVLSGEATDTEFGQNTTFQGRLETQKTNVLKWALHWRSIVRSSLGVTAYPYCLYIRSLDLRNLKYLFEDPNFRDTTQTAFFIGDMNIFSKTQGTPMKQKMRGAKASYKRMDISLVLSLVGESVTSYISQSASQNNTTAAIEEISGDIPTGVLPKWVSRLSKLKSITLWDGAVLDRAAAEAIAHNCPDFDDLTFFTSYNAAADPDTASFFNGLNRNSLRSFTALSAGSIGPETLSSLNHHATSLKSLKLDGLRSDSIRRLSCLQGCEGLEDLDLTDADGIIDLKNTENDVYLEVVTWLGRCNQLRDLSLHKFYSGPAILTQVCLKSNIRLRELQLTGYTMVDNQDFHRALSHQTSLESLILKGDAEGAFRDDKDILIDSISHLKSLKYLNLLGISDYFKTSDILALVRPLTNLEEFHFNGYEVTDALWPGMARLNNLRALNIHAMTLFTYDGIYAYIHTLQDSNQGMLLSIMNQASEKPLTPKQENILRQSIVDKADGKLEFQLFREPDSESESLSD